MASVTYYAVIRFSRDDEGHMIPGEVKKAPSGERARRPGQAMADKPKWAIAFSRTPKDPHRGDFEGGQVIIMPPAM